MTHYYNIRNDFCISLLKLIKTRKVAEKVRQTYATLKAMHALPLQSSKQDDVSNT